MTLDVLTIGALLLVPGVGAALALARPGAVAIETRLALAFGLGYALVAGLSTALVLGRVFTRTTFVVVIGAATVAVWILALRDGGARAHASALVRQAREAPFTLAASLATIAAVAATVPLFPAARSLISRSPLMYWSDGLDVAAAGRVPETKPQWGIEITPAVSKLGLNAFEGGVSFLLGLEPFPTMHAVITIAVIGFVTGLLALGRELGLGVFAPILPALTALVPPILPLSSELAQDLMTHKAENVGRMAAFGALAVAMYVLRARRGLGFAVLAGVALAVSGLTHLIPTVMAGFFLLVYALTALVRSRADIRPVLVRGAAIAGAFGVCYFAAIGLTGAALGFDSAAGAKFEQLPAEIEPTRSFSRGTYVRRGSKEREFVLPPRRLLAAYGDATVRRTGSEAAALAALLALGAGSLALALLVRRVLPAVVLGGALVVVLIGAALFFSYRYDTRVPGDFGKRRLYDYAVFPPALFVAASLAALAALLAGGRARVTAALSLLAGAVAVAAAASRVPASATPPAAERGLPVIEQVARVVPCDARMVSNARTAGTWRGTSGRTALTEGHAPFLRPDVMSRALDVITSTTAFFRDPQAERAFLEREEIDYLVVVEQGVWVGFGGRPPPRKGDVARVARLDGVHPVFTGDGVTIFAVGDEARAEAGGEPRWCQRFPT